MSYITSLNVVKTGYKWSTERTMYDTYFVWYYWKSLQVKRLIQSATLNQRSRMCNRLFRLKWILIIQWLLPWLCVTLTVQLVVGWSDTWDYFPCLINLIRFIKPGKITHINVEALNLQVKRRTDIVFVSVQIRGRTYYPQGKTCSTVTLYNVSILTLKGTLQQALGQAAVQRSTANMTSSVKGALCNFFTGL